MSEPKFVIVPVDETVRSAVVPVAELLIVSCPVLVISNTPEIISIGLVVIVLPVMVIVVPEGTVPEGADDAATHDDVLPSNLCQFEAAAHVPVPVPVVL